MRQVKHLTRWCSNFWSGNVSNALRLGWTFEEVDERLHAIMKEIHRNCVKFGTKEDGTVNYVDGANIAGFVKVADAMLSQGVF